MTVHEPDTMVCHVMVSTIWRWVSSLGRFPLRREPAAHRAGPFLEKHLDLAHGLWLGRSSNVTLLRGSVRRRSGSRDPDWPAVAWFT